MHTANELRQQFHDTYKTLLGRNLYSQSLRNYVYQTKEGNYYSDCSSSICATMKKIGLDMGLLNTAGMYHSSLWKQVDVKIVHGHVAHEDLKKLRVGDALMFRGNDPARPMQIGHVEAVYKISGTSEHQIFLCGHGSRRPSIKNMKSYCTLRESANARNGKSKGLVCILRAIPDEITSRCNPAPTLSPKKSVPTKITQSKKAIQHFLNTYYKDDIKRRFGTFLHEDGKIGRNSKHGITVAMQVELNRLGANVTIDGYFGPACATAFQTYVGTLKKGSKGIFVTLWQCYLVGHNYNPNGIDGIFGSGCVRATHQLITDTGLRNNSTVTAIDIANLL